MVRRDRLRAAIAKIPCSPLGEDVLGHLYAALGRVEAWLEQTEYEPKTWKRMA
jgi:hypothetical protein